MRTFVRLVSALAVATAVSVASAAPPPGVTGIKVVEQDGVAVVSWNAVPGGKVEKYRVYYSTVSIIGNDGDYDDYAETKDSKTQLALSDAPTTGTLYVSVLAVNDKGEESELFTEEAKLAFTGQTASTASSTSSVRSVTNVPAAGPFLVTKVQAASATGVAVSFNHQVLIYPEDAAAAFKVTDASGSTLTIKRLEVSGSDVLIHTSPQVRGATYTLVATSKVHGTPEGDGPQPLLTMQESAASMTFEGHATGVDPAQRPALANASSAIRNLKMKVTPRSDGLFDVEVTWMAPAAGDPVSYSVYQSRDGGKTYGSPQSVPGSTTAIRIDRVPAGDFGLSVQGVRADGSTTQSVFQSIRLSTAGSTVAGNVTGSASSAASSATSTVQTRTKSPLTQTGPEMLIGVALAGASTGWGVSLRRKKRS